VPAVRQQHSHFPGATDSETRGCHVFHHSARVIAQRVTASATAAVTRARLAYPARGKSVRRTVAAHTAGGQLHE